MLPAGVTLVDSNDFDPLPPLLNISHFGKLRNAMAIEGIRFHTFDDFCHILIGFVSRHLYVFDVVVCRVFEQWMVDDIAFYMINVIMILT